VVEVVGVETDRGITTAMVDLAVLVEVVVGQIMYLLWAGLETCQQ
jgi:hypothetical protein